MQASRDAAVPYLRLINITITRSRHTHTHTPPRTPHNCLTCTLAAPPPAAVGTGSAAATPAASPAAKETN